MLERALQNYYEFCQSWSQKVGDLGWNLNPFSQECVKEIMSKPVGKVVSINVTVHWTIFCTHL